MLKIKRINNQKLEKAGFEKTPHGFCKVIKNDHCSNYTLFILSDDIYGTISEKSFSDKVEDYEDWLEKLGFKYREKRTEVEQLVSELQISGAITAVNEN